MKTYLPLIIIFLAFSGIVNSNAQNLVVNSSLDVQVMCPAAGGIVNAVPWNSPTNYSADLMNDTCPSQNMAAHTGHGCAGIYTYNGVADQRQYIQGQLSSALVAGQQYTVSFWTHRINNHWASNRMSVYLSNGAVSQPILTNLSFVPQVDFISGVSGPLNSPNWQQLSGTFVAAGGEDHILIGSFYPDVQTTLYIAVASSPNYTAYYLIDDISVTDIPTGITGPQLSAADIKVFPQPGTDNITIQYPARWQVHGITLVDAAGRQIQLSLVSGSAGEARLLLENLLPGIYFLTLETAQGIINKKIVLIGK
jgi:hypothetical protein